MNRVDDAWRLEVLISKHCNRMGMDVDTAKRNLIIFAGLVGKIENNGMLVGKNPKSSAKGLYQFTDDSMITALNRIKRTVGTRGWMIKARGHMNANLLDYYQQTLLFIGNLLEMRGTDSMMKLVMIGDRAAMLDVYLKFHHTNPDDVTTSRAECIIC